MMTSWWELDTDSKWGLTIMYNRCIAVVLALFVGCVSGCSVSKPARPTPPTIKEVRAWAEQSTGVGECNFDTSVVPIAARQVKHGFHVDFLIITNYSVGPDPGIFVRAIQSCIDVGFAIDERPLSVGDAHGVLWNMCMAEKNPSDYSRSRRFITLPFGTNASLYEPPTVYSTPTNIYIGCRLPIRGYRSDHAGPPAQLWLNKEYWSDDLELCVSEVPVAIVEIEERK
jgi:hypothetical protein